jgi:cytidylate kinase
VLTVDGPSGSGKGTISRQVASRLGWHLLDSGALYRLVGLAAARRQVSLDDGNGLAALATAMRVRFEADAERVELEGADVTGDLRTEVAGEAASRVAAIPAVRAALLQRQRDFAHPPGLVADGRDMGTVVFPAATLKVFLTASAEERASRRHKQLRKRGLMLACPTFLGT